jgi:type II secretory pathway component PulF
MLTWSGLGLSLFYVPRVLCYWSEAGLPLSAAQKLFVASTRFVNVHWMICLPALLAGTVAALWWRIQAVRKTRAG